MVSKNPNTEQPIKHADCGTAYQIGWTIEYERKTSTIYRVPLYKCDTCGHMFDGPEKEELQ